MIAKFYDELTKALDYLPGEEAHLQMFPKRTKASVVRETTNYKEAAVLLLLHYARNDFQITLTQRHEYEGAHSGQISFPGGKKEPIDDNLLATALRETREEIGVNESDLTVLGELTELYIPVSNFLVKPYVAFHASTPHYIKEEAEVKEIFNFPMRDLLNKKTYRASDIRTGDKTILKNIPSFVYHEKIIWGATALILNELKLILERDNLTKILP